MSDGERSTATTGLVPAPSLQKASLLVGSLSTKSKRELMPTRIENFFECLEIENDFGKLSPEENLDNFPITHGEGCWSWGPKHYECACAEVAKAKGWSK